MNQRVFKINNFSKQGEKLRSYFDEQFRDPHSAHQKRFVWDYWSVKEQYRLMRTPAYHYFPENIYNSWHAQLVDWGRKTLGCHDISPPWLSYYVDGSYQNMHADLPHGPWAYVYSLTFNKRKFRGGETFLLKENVLNFWSQNSLSTTFESRDMFELVKPDFNRLIVFDPRIPHGVTPVTEVEDPREGRIVIHGWFVEPRPFVEGALKTSDVTKQLEESVYKISMDLNRLGSIHGVMSCRLQIQPSGRVKNIQWLSNTLRPIDQTVATSLQIKKLIEQPLEELQFKPKSGQSFLTIPLIFK